MNQRRAVKRGFPRVARQAEGLLSDRVGATTTLAVIGLLVVVTIPLARRLRLPLLSDPARVS